MRIKNEMEVAVRAAIDRQTYESGSSQSFAQKTLALAISLLSRDHERPTCSCALCNADSVALSLNNLPSCYCRAHHYGIGLEKVGVEEVEARVQKALRRVSLHPKHPSSRMIPEQSKIILVDLGLREGVRMVGPLLRRVPGACDCPSCREDALALALNNTPPKYCVSVLGRFRFPPHHLDFFRHEFHPLLAEAVKKVACNPRHDGAAGEQTGG